MNKYIFNFDEFKYTLICLGNINASNIKIKLSVKYI